MRRRALTFALLLAASAARPAAAWPADLSQKIAKDALRLLPRSLRDLFKDHEKEIFGEGRETKMAALPLVYQDLPKGRLEAATKAAIAKEVSDRLAALHGDDFRSAIISLGATYRLVVDLSDP